MVAPADAAPAPDPAPDDPRRRRRQGWLGVAVAAACFLTGLVTASLLGATYAVARGLDQAEAERDLGFTLVSAAGLWVGFLLLPLLWSSRNGGPRRELGLAARWVDIPLGLAAGLGTVVVTAVVSSAALSTGEEEELESLAQDMIDRAQGRVAPVLLFVALCVVTPVAEEVFFRGLLFRSLHRAAGLVVALLLGGLVFGLGHFSGDADGMALLVQLGILSLFGLVLCALTHRTGRLGAAIVAHAVFNSVTVLSLLAERAG